MVGFWIKLRGLLMAVAIFGLVSCGRQTHLESGFDEYAARLSRTLEADVPVYQAIAGIPLDAPKIEIPRVKISLLEFLSLFGCELQYTIGERNSSLGCVATDSQRLLNTLKLLRQAPDCIERLGRDGREEDAGMLKELVLQKRLQLPALIYNATLAGPEFREFWSQAIPEDYPNNTNSEVVDALEKLNGLVERWMGGELRADGVEFEQVLGQLRQGDGGALIRAMAISRYELERAGSIVEARLARRTVCLIGNSSPMSRTFERVVSKYFVGSVQVRQAVINRRQFELFLAIEGLEKALSEVLPAAYRRWVLARNALVEDYRNAPRAHVAQIKQVLQQCGSSFAR